MKFPTLRDELVRTPERDATAWRPPSREQIERLRKRYPIGATVKLISMEDAQSPPPGTLGKIHGVDDAGSILVAWQNGSSLSLIPDVDSFRIVKEATDNE